MKLQNLQLKYKISIKRFVIKTIYQLDSRKTKKKTLTKAKISLYLIFLYKSKYN